MSKSAYLAYILKLLSRVSFFLIVFLLVVFFTQLSIPEESKIMSVGENSSNTNYAQNLAKQTLSKYDNAQEVIELRDEKSKTYLLETSPDGKTKYALNASTAPVHFKRAQGNWEEIDTGLVPYEGKWDYAMEKADYSFYVNENLESEGLIEFKRKGEYIRFSPLSLSSSGPNSEKLISNVQPSVGVVKNNSITWSGAFGEGTELSWSVFPERLAKLLKLENLESLGDLDNSVEKVNFSMSFEYSPGVTIFIDGESWDGISIDTRETIEFRNNQGETIWSFRKPLVWDSNGDLASDNYLGLETRNGKLIITHSTSMDWLNKAKFPVFIDPDLCSPDCLVSAGVDDGFIDNIGFINNWTFNIIGASSAPNTYNAFSRFTIPQVLGGSTIITATYSLYIQPGGVGVPKTAIRAEKSAAPTTITSNADYLSRNLTGAVVYWNMGQPPGQVYIDSPSIVSVIEEVAGYNPTAIQIMHMDNGSSQTGSNYIANNTYESDPINRVPKLYIEYTPVAPDPDFMITKKSTDTTPTVDLIADHADPSSAFGNRTFAIGANIPLHGWVRNPTGPAGNVELCFYEESLGSDGPIGACTNPVTIEVPPGGWQGSLGGMPFGTACADVDGDGQVTAVDVAIIVANQGPNPQYDITDDGEVDLPQDILGAMYQEGVNCNRNLSLAANSMAGDYELWARVDGDNTHDEGANEGNNDAGPDEYEMIEDPLRTMEFTQTNSNRLVLSTDTFDNADNVVVTLDAATPPGWDNAGSVYLTLRETPQIGSLTVGFGTAASPEGVSVSWDPRGSQSTFNKEIYVITNDTPSGIYDIEIEANAYNSSPFFQATEILTFKVFVVDDLPWFKTTSGDVAAKGKLSTSPPIVNLTENIGADYGQMVHNVNCVYRAPPCNHNHGPTYFASYVVNFGGQVGLRDNRPPNSAGMVNFNRVYLTFDTSSVSGPVVKAELEFMPGPFPSPNTTVGIYQSDSLSWTQAQLEDQVAAGALWHETNQVILGVGGGGGLAPLFTFNTSVDSVQAGVKFTIPQNVASSINKGGITQWVMMWTEELSWSWNDSCPDVSDCPSWLLRLSDPTLIVDSVLFQDVSTTYLGLSDGDLNPFYSVKDWLIKDYASGDGGINEDFSAANFQSGNPDRDIYAYLWEKFGKQKYTNCSDLGVGACTANPPDMTGVYLYDGSADVSLDPYLQPGPTTQQNVVIFYPGDIEITGGSNPSPMPDYLNIVYIVDGDIGFNKIAGAYQSRFDGLFITNGRFISGNSSTPPASSCPECALEVVGGIIAQQGFDLGRDLGLSNDSDPAEQITFDPSYLYYFARIENTAVPGLDYSLLGESGAVAREVPP